jgi:hypothetical protein
MSHHPIPGTVAINFNYVDGRKMKLKNCGHTEKLQSDGGYSYLKQKSVGKSFRAF